MKTHDKKNKTKVVIEVILAGILLVVFFFLLVSRATAAVELELDDADIRFDQDPYNGRWLGSAMTLDGDYNNDGLADIAIADGSYYNSGNMGRVYIIYGSSSLSTVMNLRQGSSDLDILINGEVSSGTRLAATSGAVDLDGRGTSDLIIHGPDVYGQYKGIDFVLFGEDMNALSTINLNTANSANHKEWYGELAWDEVGSDVSAAGDITGDGLADVVLVARNNDGKAYIKYGSTNLPTTSGSLLVISGDVEVNGNASGYPDVKGGVDIGGDINGDGIGDVIIGAYQGYGAYIEFGENGGLSRSTINLETDSMDLHLSSTAWASGGAQVNISGDLNGDGVNDVILGDGSKNAYILFGRDFGATTDINLDTSSDVVITSPSGTLLGTNHAIEIGDINKDGIDDLFLGDPSADPNGTTDGGQAFIIFGRSSWSSALNLENESDTGGTWNVTMFEGTANYQRIGASLSIGGDVDNDGMPDVILGGGTGSQSNKAYLFSGSSIAAANPEPATMVLFGVGLAGLGWKLKRKRRK